MDVEDNVEINLDELHHRLHDVRDHLFKGESMVLTSEGEQLAVIKPMSEKDEIPERALVRSISFIRSHRRMLSYRLREGSKIVITYRGRKMGVIDPEPA
jgi:antitoxin (DNA-binding transcriptional repressor) of toxin-antitoxin stability system